MLAAVQESASVNVSLASADDADEWDAYVSTHPGSSFCHLWGWGQLIQEVFGHRPMYLLAREEAGSVDGVLPLVCMRSLLGRHLVSVPYVNYGGPLGSRAACEALTRSARDLAARSGARKLELRSRAPQETELGPSRQKVTVVLPLPSTVEELWQRTFRAKLRSQIRRAQKEEMEVRFGRDQVDAFYRVFSRNMRDLGTPVLPRPFFSGLPRYFGGQVVFAAVYADGSPVAAACGFTWRDEFEITWASSLREHNAKAPNMLLYASLMEEMIRRGVRAFNFGRCTPGSGTHRFKLQWGGTEEPLHWSTWPGEAATAGDEGRIFRLASQLWQRMPLPLAELLGPAIARRLPQF